MNTIIFNETTINLDLVRLIQYSNNYRQIVFCFNSGETEVMSFKNTILYGQAVTKLESVTKPKVL